MIIRQRSGKVKDGSKRKPSIYIYEQDIFRHKQTVLMTKVPEFIALLCSLKMLLSPTVTTYSKELLLYASDDECQIIQTSINLDSIILLSDFNKWFKSEYKIEIKIGKII